MFNNYYSVTIPFEKKLKNLIARSKDNRINFVDGINESTVIKKIKKFNYNCHYVVLLPASSLVYHSVELEENKDYKVSEQRILNELSVVDKNFNDQFYYDYLEIESEKTKNREIKFFAAKKDYLDKITNKMEDYKNDYLVSALPIAIFTTVNKLVKSKNYCLYYKINNQYTIVTALDKKIDLLQSGISENRLESTLNENKKFYLNNGNIILDVLEGKKDLLELEEKENIELEDDDFIFLTSLLWSIDKCQ